MNDNTADQLRELERDAHELWARLVKIRDDVDPRDTYLSKIKHGAETPLDRVRHHAAGVMVNQMSEACNSILQLTEVLKLSDADHGPLTW